MYDPLLDLLHSCFYASTYKVSAQHQNQLSNAKWMIKKKSAKSPLMLIHGCDNINITTPNDNRASTGL